MRIPHMCKLSGCPSLVTHLPYTLSPRSVPARSLALACALSPATACKTDVAVDELNAQFSRQVDHRLVLLVAEQQRYIGLRQQELSKANLLDMSAQTFLVVDRSPLVQAAFLLLRTGPQAWHWVGAVAVSTGRPGGFAHFISPLGVFLHSPANPDYRSAGTYNQNHIRGYGAIRMRVFDFGWQTAHVCRSKIYLINSFGCEKGSNL
jgi:hypothetical protein